MSHKCWLCGKNELDKTHREFGVCWTCSTATGLAALDPRYAIGASVILIAMETYAATDGNHAVKSAAANAVLENALALDKSGDV